MRALSPTRRRRSRAAMGFSLKPVAVLLCAVLIVRLFATTDVLRVMSDTVSDWTSGEDFAQLAMKGAGVPGFSEDRVDWLTLLTAQSSALAGMAAALEHAVLVEEDTAPSHLEPEVPEPAALFEPSMAPPDIKPTFSRSFWYNPLDDSQRYISQEEVPESITEPGPSEIPLVDDRDIPVPKPEDPGAKRVLEVTLTAPEGASSGVYINNKTKYTVSAEGMLAQKSVLKASDPVKPQILIIHTHGSESFLPDERDYYIPTDIERTEDTRYNVVKLGDEMEKGLTALGLNVLHDREIYDSPSYNGAYGRSLAAIQKYMKDYPSIQVVIDIHRDSISASDGSMYKTVSATDMGKAAQMMIVVGSEGSGLTHPNWKQNLAFACRLEKAVLDKYPTLMRPVSFRKERFNQHATSGSIILEVGTAGNTLSEAVLAIELFCDTAGAKLAEQLLN